MCVCVCVHLHVFTSISKVTSYSCKAFFLVGVQNILHIVHGHVMCYLE